MTKIGIISDIHAHHDRLERALKHVNKLGVDTIVCTGDLVDRGDDGDVVVARIRDLEIPTVLGNHDWSAPHTQLHRQRLAHMRLFIPPLKDETIEFLKGLPRTLHIEFEGRTICLAHGSPTSFHHRVEPHSTLPLFKRVLRDAGAKIVLLRHTHMPMVVEVEGYGKIINSGSILQNYPTGRYRELPPTFAILALPSADITHYHADTGDIVAVPYIQHNPTQN